LGNIRRVGISEIYQGWNWKKTEAKTAKPGLQEVSDPSRPLKENNYLYLFPFNIFKN
jgi:hypothetical protein